MNDIVRVSFSTDSFLTVFLLAFVVRIAMILGSATMVMLGDVMTRFGRWIGR